MTCKIFMDYFDVVGHPEVLKLSVELENGHAHTLTVLLLRKELISFPCFSGCQEEIVPEKSLSWCLRLIWGWGFKSESLTS